MPIHRLLRIAELRELEKSASHLPLMERAGAAAADYALQIGSHRCGPIWLLVGPGNNGGDALVAARILAEQGIAIEVALLEPPEQFKAEAQDAWQAWLQCDLPIRHDLQCITTASVVIDGLYGIGLRAATTRALSQTAQDWIAQVNHLTCPVLALDVPSGLDAESGQAISSGAIYASHTLTLIADKPGLHTRDGPDHAGEIKIASLGLDCSETAGQLNQVALFKAYLTPRRCNSHKGLFGSVGVLGGQQAMVGAALLAGRTALYAGAGRVYVQLLSVDAPTVDLLQPELMLCTQLDDHALSAAVVGPGLGESKLAQTYLAKILQQSMPCVLDADALNQLAQSPAMIEQLRARQDATVLTPHPLEAARLLGIELAQVQQDRIAAAVQLAHACNAVVVLKGVGSVIASPDGRWVINPTGNPGLATAGSGDVLAGLIGALLAQAWPAWQATLAGVWLHGAGADTLVRQGIGPVGMVASELIAAIRQQLNHWTYRTRDD